MPTQNFHVKPSRIHVDESIVDESIRRISKKITHLDDYTCQVLLLSDRTVVLARVPKEMK